MSVIFARHEVATLSMFAFKLDCQGHNIIASTSLDRPDAVIVPAQQFGFVPAHETSQDASSYRLIAVCLSAMRFVELMVWASATKRERNISNNSKGWRTWH
jgi:hypothetical protein